MDPINNAFFENSLKVNRNLLLSNIEKINFPLIDYSVPGDNNFKKLWNRIDQAKDYVWILSYIFDSTFPAQITMIKLIEAQKRGVHCILMVDDLNNWVDHSLKKEFLENGGTIHSLNPIGDLGKILNKEFFRRHHEKLTVIDDKANIGSSNIADEYAGYKYGTFDYLDLNLFTENVCLEEIRGVFYKICEFYHLNLHPIKTNEEIIKLYDKKYPNSKFLNHKPRILRMHQSDILEIQPFLLEKFGAAQKKIIIIQPYYYPIKKVENSISDALDRGVEVELITSAKRDPPIYTRLKNAFMLRRLIKKGLKVYEIHDKFLHMKGYSIDGKIITIGSFNNDKWSWGINDEANIVIEDEFETNKFQREIIDELKKKCLIADLKFHLTFMRKMKIKFWEGFISVSEWIMNKRRFDKKEASTKIREGMSKIKGYSFYNKIFTNKLNITWNQDILFNTFD